MYTYAIHISVKKCLEMLKKRFFLILLSFFNLNMQKKHFFLIIVFSNDANSLDLTDFPFLFGNIWRSVTQPNRNLRLICVCFYAYPLKKRPAWYFYAFCLKFCFLFLYKFSLHSLQTQKNTTSFQKIFFILF